VAHLSNGIAGKPADLDCHHMAGQQLLQAEVEGE
jgi:hypothetical protein